MKPDRSNRRVRTALAVVLLTAWPLAAADAQTGNGAKGANGTDGAAAAQKAHSAKDVRKRMYREGNAGPATLRYVAHVPVLKVYGTPEEIGEQSAKLLGDAGAVAVRRYLDTILIGPLRSLVLMQSRKMEPHIPDAFRREMRAFAAHSSLSYEDVLLINTFADIKKMIRCTTIAVSADHNPAGHPLLGRNFDFPSFGFAHEYGVVIVVHPEGKRAFASVGHPGLVGTHSFLNEDGLAGAVMEVYSGRPKFSPKAMPALMLYRTVAESCNTVDAALDILRTGPRCSSNNFILQTADSKAALAEFTVRQFAVRHPEDGLLFGTNHHRSETLSRNPRCRRMNYLLKERDAGGTWSLEQIIARLRKTALRRLNFYSMVLSPAERTIYVAMGKLPAANDRFVKLDRTTLFVRTLRRRTL